MALQTLEEAGYNNMGCRKSAKKLEAYRRRSVVLGVDRYTVPSANTTLVFAWYISEI